MNILKNFPFHVANILFFSMNGFELLSFFGLALKWPDLMRQWQVVESLPVFQSQKHKNVYIFSIRIIASTALLMALSTIQLSTVF